MRDTTADRIDGPLVVLDASVEVARAATAASRRTILVQRPGDPVWDLVDDQASLYTVDLTDQRFPSFVKDVLGPLAPRHVVSLTAAGEAAAALARGVLGLPEPPADLVAHLGAAASAPPPPPPLPPPPTRSAPSPTPPPPPPAPVTGDRARRTSGPAKPAVLLLNHHPYGHFTRAGRHLLPTAEVDLHLVTRNRRWGGVRGLAEHPVDQVAVCDVDDEDQWRTIGEWWLANRPIERVVAVHERSVLPAADLRTRFGLPGLGYDAALRFRDKVRMKRAVAEAGAARTPAFAALDTPEDLDRMDWDTGPKVIKPRGDLAARGVHVVADRAAAHRVCATLDLGDEAYEIEDFVEGEIYHCDAVVRAGRILFSSVGRYLANPASYAPGGIFGTVLVTEGELARRIRELNARVLAALGMADGTTHLELFHTPADELVFCEVAGRPPGGVIPPVIEWQYGFNIVEADLRLQAGLELPWPELTGGRHGEPPAPRPGTPRDGVCGFLAFYPGGGTGSGDRGLPAASPAAAHLLEYLHHPGAGDGRGGVRHSTDFLDSYVVGAPDTRTLLSRIEEIRRTYRHG